MGPSPFRGQYFLGPAALQRPREFASVNIINNRILLYHRSLPVSVQKSSDKTGILLGFAFDTRNPHSSLDDILASLLQKDSAQIIRDTGRLAGRWNLVILGDEQEIALGDACGTLPIAYYLNGDGATSIASSTKLLGYCLGDLQKGELAGPEFRKIQNEANYYSGLAFPVSMTEYAGVGVLLPNHCLDLKTGSPNRFHPSKPYPRLTAKEMAPQIATTLQNIIRAASLRFALGAAITSGYDSRIVAGAISRVPGLAKKTCFFTFQDPYDTTPGHFDILNGRRISEAAGGTHREIKVTEAVGAARSMCRASEAMIAPRFENWAARCLSEPFQNRLILMGWCSEIARCYIRWPGSEDHVDADQIAGCMGVKGLCCTTEEFVRWQKEAAQLQRDCGIPLLDLFYWEMRAGRWCSAGLNVLNSGSNWITPYSCRDLLDLMLSVAEPERGGSEQFLYRAIINELNPALMKIPFNPHPISWWKIRKVAKHYSKAAFVSSAKAIGLYEFARKWKRGRFVNQAPTSALRSFQYRHQDTHGTPTGKSSQRVL